MRALSGLLERGDENDLLLFATGARLIKTWNSPVL